MIENNIYFSNLLIIIEDHPVVLSHTLSLPFPLSSFLALLHLFSFLLLNPAILLSDIVVPNLVNSPPPLPHSISVSVSVLFKCLIYSGNALLYFHLLSSFLSSSYSPFSLSISKGTNEIGIPVQFAKVLHYPTPVNDFNIR